MKRFKAIMQPAITKFCSSSRDAVILDDDSPLGNSSNQQILTAPLNLMFSDDEFSISSQPKLGDTNHNDSRTKCPEVLSDLGDLFESNANDFPHEIEVGDSDIDLFESNVTGSVYNRDINAVSDGWPFNPETQQVGDTANVHNLDNLQKSSLELAIPPTNTKTYKGYTASGSSSPLIRTPSQLSDLKFPSPSRSCFGKSNCEFLKMNEFEDKKLPKGRPSYDEIIKNLDSAISSTTASIDLVARNQLAKSPRKRKREQLGQNPMERPEQTEWSLMRDMKIKIKRAMYNVPTKSSSPYRDIDHADLANSLFPDNEVDLVTDDRENDCNTDEPFVNLNNVKGSGATELAGYFNQFEFTKRSSSSTKEPKCKGKAPAKKRNIFKGKSFWANKKRKG